jgi:hypothetical protein
LAAIIPIQMARVGLHHDPIDPATDLESHAINRFENNWILARLFTRLHPREKELIYKYYGLADLTPRSLRDLRNDFNLTTTHMSRIVQGALAKLKKWLEEPAGTRASPIGSRHSKLPKYNARLELFRKDARDLNLLECQAIRFLRLADEFELYMAGLDPKLRQLILRDIKFDSWKALQELLPELSFPVILQLANKIINGRQEIISPEERQTMWTVMARETNLSNASWMTRALGFKAQRTRITIIRSLRRHKSILGVSSVEALMQVMPITHHSDFKQILEELLDEIRNPKRSLLQAA